MSSVGIAIHFVEFNMLPLFGDEAQNDHGNIYEGIGSYPSRASGFAADGVLSASRLDRNPRS